MKSKHQVAEELAHDAVAAADASTACTLFERALVSLPHHLVPRAHQLLLDMKNMAAELRLQAAPDKVAAAIRAASQEHARVLGKLRSPGGEP